MSAEFEKFKDLFAGREDVYAKVTTVVQGKARYMCVKEPLTDAILLDHIKGSQAVGIYPIKNNKVKWGLVDIDGNKDPETKEFLPESWSISLTKAVEQRNAYRALGLHAYIERSRSGAGAHVWVFFEDWIPASAARRLLLSRLVVEKRAEVVYPVQDTLTEEDDFGNLLGLPFFGGVIDDGFSVFVEDNGTPLTAKQFFERVRTNKIAVVREILEELPDNPENARNTIRGNFAAAVDNTRPQSSLVGGLKIISQYGCKFMHDAWVNRKTLQEPNWYVAIQQATALHRGREFAHAISRDYPKYNAREVDAKFDQAQRNPVASCAYIRERFPELACPGCPFKFPYQTATKSIIQLVQESSEEMERVGSFSEDLDRVRAYDEGKATNGVRWGLDALNEHNRIRNSELVVVGGFPSLGKTAFMVDNAVQMADKGVVIPIFSAETARNPLRMRLLSNVSGVDLSALRGERPGLKLTDQEWKALRKAEKKLETLPIYTDFTSMSPSRVLEQIEDILLRDNIPLDAQYVLFFDYLQFGFKEPGEERDYDRLTRLAGEFKFVSKILDHGSVIFSQLKREKESNTDDEDEEVHPELNWFAGTGAIERTMDTGMIITGKRTGGIYASRKITKVKDRDGRAPTEDRFVLQQPCGRWRPPYLENTPRSLTDDFNAN